MLPWHIFAASLAFVVPLTASSQSDTLLLTLDKVISIAREQSPEALIARHRFKASYWGYRSYKAEYLPSVEVDAVLPSFSQSFRTISQADGPDIFQYNSLTSYYANLTVNQKVGWTGGSVFLRSNLQRLDNITDTTWSQYQSVPIVIGFSQPIFQFNEYRWSRKIEPLQYEKAKRRYLEDVENVTIKSSNYFFNLLLAQVEKEIARKNLGNYDTLYRVALGRFQLGKIAENELLQLELNFLRARSAVDNANLNYENMIFQLRSYLRLKEDRPLVLIPPGSPEHMPVMADKAVAEARKNTSTAIDFRERLLTAESDLRRAKMNGRFDADLYLEYGLTQSAPDIQDVYNDPQEQQRINLGLSIPLLDWGVARGQIKVAESNLELERTAVEQEVIDFERNVFLKVMQFNMQNDQLLIAAKADTVAQKRFDVTQRRYMIGVVNDVLELNNAQIDNDESRKGYYQALRNYWINLFELRKLTLYDFTEDRMIIFDLREAM